MSEEFDIAVAGSGAAGMAAAVCAARAGCKTLLMDTRPAAGGTGGFSGLTTLCGLFDEDCGFLNAGFTQEFAEALAKEDGEGAQKALKMGRVQVQLYRPSSFQRVGARLLAAEPALTLRWETPVREVRMEAGWVVSLDGARVKAVIDCTGTAEVGRASGEMLMATDETTQAPSVVFPLAKVERDLSTPVAAAQVLLVLARAGFPAISFMPTLEAGTVAAKFAGPPADVPRLLKFLRAGVPGFERCETKPSAVTLGQRAGTMIVGRHVLTGAEVLGAGKFPDAVARGCWPIEQWLAGGKPRVRHLKPGEFYEIPAGSLRAARTENLFMAGKSLSADVDAVASARVMGICLATGAAAGQLAAAFVTSGSRR